MRLIVWGSLLTALGALVWSSDARACGGCFVVPVQGNDTGGTIVTSHRMALSLSTEQTVLWDQIQYTGSPSGFAWVLPVKPGARIEVASEAWFDVLDAASGTAVSPPPMLCKSPTALSCSVAPAVGASVTGGCSADLAGGGDPGALPDPVQVVSHGATGPYESAVIHSDVPGALPLWLDQHGYAIPDGIAPVIEAYAKEGFDFAALRLLPSSGVQQMRPVRVVQAGAVPVLPLRMVAAGTGPNTAITLFVIGEGRYTTKNFPEVPVERGLVTWDFDAASSNYSVLRDAAYRGGHTFFTPYAAQGALFDAVIDPTTGYASRYQTTTGWAFTTVAETFIHQAFVNGESSSTDCAAGFDELADDGRRVVRLCDDDLDPECQVDSVNEIDARAFECDAPLGSDIPLDDLAQALVGLHPRDVWITRLEANLARDALATDLELMPAPSQVEVSGPFQAARATRVPETCKLAPAAALAGDPASGGDKPNDRRGPGPLTPLLSVPAMGLLILLRRLLTAAQRKRRAAPAKQLAGREWGVAR